MDGLPGGSTAYLIDSGIPAFPDDFWLTAEPSSGTLEPGETAVITVTVDTAGLAPGLYEGRLVIQSESGRRPTSTVPVTFDVLMVNAAWVEGVVTDANDNLPVAGATVSAVQDGQVIKQAVTGDDGFYRLSCISVTTPSKRRPRTTAPTRKRSPSMWKTPPRP